MSLRQRILVWFHDHPRYKAWALLAPGLTWLLAFFILPLVLMFAYSFMPRNSFGGVDTGFTLEHYARFFDPLYVAILWRTTLYAVLCTVLCLLLGYPVAYAMARGGRWRNLLIQTLDIQRHVLLKIFLQTRQTERPAERDDLFDA